MRIAGALGAMVLACSHPAMAQQVRFTGQTGADQTLLRDALQQLARHAYATLSCATLTAVSSTVLPDGFEPRPANRVAARIVRYERWDATLCGRTVSYLFGYWPSPEGGSMFQVSYPFPAQAEAVSPASRP